MRGRSTSRFWKPENIAEDEESLAGAEVQPVGSAPREAERGSSATPQTLIQLSSDAQPQGGSPTGLTSAVNAAAALSTESLGDGGQRKNINSVVNERFIMASIESSQGKVVSETTLDSLLKSTTKSSAGFHGGYPTTEVRSSEV